MLALLALLEGGMETPSRKADADPEAQARLAAEDGDELVDERGVGHRVERLELEDGEGARRRRDHVAAALPAAEQRHLADHRAGAHDAQDHAVGHLRRELAAQQDADPRRVLARLHEQVVRFELQKKQRAERRGT